MNRKKLYWIGGIFHLLTYTVFRRRIAEIDEDLHQYTQGRDGARAFIEALTKREYRSAFYFRLPRLFWWPLSLLLPKMQNCYLQCKIGGGMRIMHGFSSIINATSIGRNFEFYQNVTVGWGRLGNPTIGDNVSIYAGAVVAGKIRIGNNVKICANSFVRKDVPDNTLVFGNPAQYKPL